jgi:hypothetical protein
MFARFTRKMRTFLKYVSGSKYMSWHTKNGCGKHNKLAWQNAGWQANNTCLRAEIATAGKHRTHA